MDRATENLIVRIAGSIALAFVLIHGGQDIERRSAPWAFIAFYVALAIAGNWALARLNAKRAALWTTLVALGAFPALMPVLHMAEMGTYNGLYMAVLYVTSAAGVATGAIAAWMLRGGVRPE